MRRIRSISGGGWCRSTHTRGTCRRGGGGRGGGEEGEGREGKRGGGDRGELKRAICVRTDRRGDGRGGDRGEIEQFVYKLIGVHIQEMFAVVQINTHSRYM